MTKKLLTGLTIGLALLGLGSTAAATLISDNNWNPDSLVSGRNSYGTQSEADVLNEIRDPNTPDSRFTGVVSIQIVKNGVSYICTGTAISNRHILSAGHCVDTDGAGTVIDLNDSNNEVNVVFNHDGDHASELAASDVAMHQDYSGFNVCSDGTPGCVNDDVAVITLAEDIPAGVEIYDFYSAPVKDTESNAGDGDILTMVGYGTSGDGYWGYYIDPSWTGKNTGANIVDFVEPDDEGSGLNEVWFADFDGYDDFFGTNIDTFASSFGVNSSWLDNETIIGGGDSGGPSFIYDSTLDQYFLAGINTFTISGYEYGYGWTAGAFGDLMGGILLNPYQGWIDGIIHSESDPVPEPASILLFFTGLAGIVAVKRKRKF